MPPVQGLRNFGFAKRARQRYTGACRPFRSLRRACRGGFRPPAARQLQTPRKQTRCEQRISASLRNPFRFQENL